MNLVKPLSSFCRYIRIWRICKKSGRNSFKLKGFLKFVFINPFLKTQKKGPGNIGIVTYQ